MIYKGLHDCLRFSIVPWGSAARFLTRVFRSRASTYALVGIAAVAVIGQPALQSVALAHLLAQPDTRIEAKGWIEHHIPAKARIGVEHTKQRPPLVPAEGPAPQREQLTAAAAVEEWRASRGEITERTAYQNVKRSRQGQK